MPDTFDTFKSNPGSLPPLTLAICQAFPTTVFGATVGPVASDKVQRAILDWFKAIENRMIAAGF
jgi:hypothetical protein